MKIGDLVKLRHNFRRMIGPCSEVGIVTRVNRIGNVDIMLSNDVLLTGVMLGNIELISETRIVKAD